MADHVEANYQNLKTLAGDFQQKSNEVKQMFQTLSGHLQTLRSGGWISPAATKSLKIMDEHMERMQKLQEALAKANQVIGTDVVNTFQSAEQDGQSSIPSLNDAP